MVNTVSLAQYYEETRIPLRLSCLSPSGWPVVLSLWYLFENDTLYCATPQNAKVVDFLLAEPRCSFEVASDAPPYCGVRGRAMATINERRGVEILERLLVRYVGDLNAPLAKNLLNRNVVEVAIQLVPQTVYTWNFSKRMAHSPDTQKNKCCPE